MIEKRILIIDDEIDLGEALQEILKRDFEVVDFESDPQKALALIENNRYSLILSDYKMPGLSGLDVASKIRSQGCLTTLVWISGYCDKQMALNAIRLGVVDVIEKPVTAEDLSKFVSRAYEIERRRVEIIRAKEDNLSNRKMLGLIYASDKRVEKSRASTNSL